MTMQMTQQNRVNLNSESPTAKLQRWFKTWAARRREARAEKATMAQLAAMDPYMLRDIGMHSLPTRGSLASLYANNPHVLAATLMSRKPR